MIFIITTIMKNILYNTLMHSTQPFNIIKNNLLYRYKLKFDEDISEEYLRKKLKKLKTKHYKLIIFQIKTL